LRYKTRLFCYSITVLIWQQFEKMVQRKTSHVLIMMGTLTLWIDRQMRKHIGAA
jgi:hypothetical protein